MSSEEKPLTCEEAPQSAKLDVGQHFVTDITFASKEDLLAWVRNVGRELGFVVVIQRADKLTGRARPRVMLGCDKAGFPRDNQNKKGWVKKNLRKTSSKRCGCPFSLQGQRYDTNEWKLIVKSGIHNHEFVSLESHSYAGRLDEDEQKIVHEMYASGVKPRKILLALKNRNSSNSTTMRTIYNEKFKMYRKELDGKTPIQFLNKCINEAGYINFNHMNNTTNHLESLYFTHPTSVQLSNMFSDVFIMNSYKTNRYRLPLLCIIGMTSTNHTFFSAFSFLSNETEASYSWALECFKSMLDQNSLPSVLVVDKDIALMDAIKVVFPQSKIILSQVQINKNIMTHCKKHFKQGKDCQKFLYVWQHLVNSPTTDDFNTRFNIILNNYAEQYPDVLRYVVTTWIEPYKEYFISAWIDTFLHLGNSTTNHLESSHSQLKNFLEVSIGSLTTIWKTFDEMINLQHTEIKKSFEESAIQADARFTGSLYAELLGSVSPAALDIIKKEEDLVKSGCPEAGDCMHKMRHTMGLPCAHELVPFMNQSSSFPLSKIHRHWKQPNLQLAWK